MNDDRCVVCGDIIPEGIMYCPNHNKEKNRLTKRDLNAGTAYFPECFKNPCLGIGCKKEDCSFLCKVAEKLCSYEELEAYDVTDNIKSEVTELTRYENILRIVHNKRLLIETIQDIGVELLFPDTPWCNDDCGNCDTVDAPGCLPECERECIVNWLNEKILVSSDE